MTEVKERTRRYRPIAAVAIGAVAAGSLFGWAGATILTPPQDVLSTEAYTYVEVVEGEVGSSLSLNTVAEWELTPVGVNQAQGVVTTVGIGSGSEVGQGTVLYTTSLRPTVAAQGGIPAFRPLQRGDTGADVGQLQTLLQSLGFYDDAIDSQFRYSTAAAVRAWQKSGGLTADGVVQAGDIIFVASLPAKLSLDADLVRVGASLVAGETTVFALSPAPIFTIPVTDSQAALITQGTRVDVTSPTGGVWTAFVSDREAGENGEVIIRLEGTEGAPICGTDCVDVPLSGQTFLRSSLITVETVEGLVLPTAAILSRADGSLVVIDDEGQEHPVSIAATAKGTSVVEGVYKGQRLRVPAEGA